MKINEDGRWGTLKLSNTFWPRSLQGPEYAGSGYVRVLLGFLGREQPVSPMGNNRKRDSIFETPPGTPAEQCTCRKDGALRCAGSNAWSEERFPPGFAGGGKQKWGHGCRKAAACTTGSLDQAIRAGMDAWLQLHAGPW